MKLLAVLTALSVTGTCTARWDNLYLKFDLLLNGYFPIALTTSAMGDEWEYMASDTELNIDFYSYGQDPRVAIGYDNYNKIAAVRVSYIISDLTNTADANGVDFPYTFTDKPIFSNGTFWDTDVYYTTVLFADPDTLKAGGRAETGGALADEIYVKINGNYTEIPKKEKHATDLGFVKQGCFIGMGQHYFLATDSSSDCNDLQGVFLLYDSEELVGMGLIPFGSFTSDRRVWFESPTSFAVKMIVPNRPSCMVDWTKKYGTTSLHLFFKKHPRLTFCPL